MSRTGQREAVVALSETQVGQGEDEGDELEQGEGEGEGEGDEPDTDEPDEDEPEELQPQAREAPSAQALMRKIDAENTRHGRTLAKLMELDPKALTECEVCGTYGFLPPGHDSSEQFEQDPGAEQCAQCKGRGLTRTGAVPPAEVVYQCSLCGGRGWRTATPMPNIPAYNPPAAAPETNAYQAPPGYVLVPVNP